MAGTIGTGANDILNGSAGADFIAGEGGADNITGGQDNDVLLGGGGNDVIAGDEGNDRIFGNGVVGGVVDMDKMRIAEDIEANVTFLNESAGYRNVLGVYKIASDGTIYDTQVLFANASLKGSGGSLIRGESSVDLSLNAGDRLGFFVVPNGYSRPGMKDLLNDDEATYKFVDKDGNPANANNDGSVKLVHVDADGKETDINSQYGTEVFHSVENLNGDNMKHVVAEVDPEAGTLKVGFEDLWRGGDRDFDDSVFSIDIGQNNAILLPRESTGGAVSTDDDDLSGGTGNDDIFGMRGDDIVRGEEGDDNLWGNSGNDKLDGGDGNDVVRGGSGDDIAYGGNDDDVVIGNSGNDYVDGGAGNDKLEGNSGNDIIADGSGNDKSSGGSGDDVFIAGLGDDYYNGGSGFDTISYANADEAINVDMSKHVVTGHGRDEIWSVEGLTGTGLDDTIKGDKRENTIDGGAGDDSIRSLGGADTLTGGEGSDSFVWFLKDVMRGEDHQGVDVITDFSTEDGDVLDLTDMFEDSPEELEGNVRLTENDNGTMVSVKVGEDFVDVVMLQNVFDQSLSSMADSESILA